MILYTPPRVMNVDRFNTDVRVESVLVEENRTASEVGHTKPFMMDFVFNIIRCFLQGNKKPFHRNLILDSIFRSTSGPRIPVVNAEPPLRR